MSSGLLLAEEPQTTQGGIWAYISASRLNCWLRCPLAFRFRYIDRLKTPTTSSLFLGKTVHSALEIYYRHLQLGVVLTVDDVSRHITETWGRAIDEEAMRFNSEADEQALRRQAGDLTAAYLHQAPKHEKPLAVEATAETQLIDPVNGEDLGIPLLGVMDLIVEGGDGPIIADFKTAARSAEPLETVHEIQLTAYSYLFRKTAGRNESGLEIRSLIKTKTPKIEFHSYPRRSEAHFRRLFSVIREYLEALEQGRFSYRPGFSCGMCDYRENPCRKWSG